MMMMMMMMMVETEEKKMGMGEEEGQEMSEEFLAWYRSLSLSFLQYFVTIVVIIIYRNNLPELNVSLTLFQQSVLVDNPRSGGRVLVVVVVVVIKLLLQCARERESCGGWKTCCPGTYCNSGFNGQRVCTGQNTIGGGGYAGQNNPGGGGYAGQNNLGSGGHNVRIIIF